MTWAELYGHAAVFRARSVFPESHVTVETGLPGLGGWTGEKENEIVRVEFRKRESKEAGPLYLFSPWQRLAWKGTGVGHPGIVTVTKHLIVLRSIDNGEQSNAQKDFALRSMRVIEDLMMT